MPIQLKVSNSLNSLADELSAEIKKQKSVFRPVYVITQTEGMNSWLKLQIAERIGISANIKFGSPNDIIREVYQILAGKQKEPISKQDFTWLIFEALNEKTFIERFPKIAQYYDNDVPDSEIKRLALAEKVADLFDQYQVYRPAMIEEWNTGKNNKKGWQEVLWQWGKEKVGVRLPDKTAMEKDIFNGLQDVAKIEKLQEQVPKVYFFGLSLITQYHYQLIQAFSPFMDIHFMMQNPAPYDYWYEDKPQKVIDFLIRKRGYPETEESLANPLLVGWGKLIQDTFMLLFENDETLNNYEELGVKAPDEKTLLHALQKAIFQNQKDNIHFSSAQVKDQSITINSCYSPIREVEALYNYLVHLVDEREENLSARDIVVMVSDIDLYASYIKAVFDNAPYKFRYNIADESYAATDSLSNALMALLSLTEDDFTSEKVVGLLEYSVLRKKFQIEDVEKIRQWVDAANIRFGIVGNEMDDSRYVSWEYGLKRIMYGLCMSGDAEFREDEEGFYPLDRIEGFDTFQAIRFVHFVETLMQSLKDRKGKRTLASWVHYVEKMITLFIEEDEKEETKEKNPLIQQLERYNVLQDVFEEKVSYEVFSYNFLPTLSKVRRSGSFSNGGVTFCSLIPMRSIPFKVVGLLGINFDNFPRIDRYVSFDLMQKKPMRGDRSLKGNDKHLFLETLLSAGDYFYLSYQGQSVKDNSTLPPSALIDEMLDFIASKTNNPEETKDLLVQRHPLHGFSRAYNTANHPELYSYLIQKDAKSLDFLGNKKEMDINFDEIPITQLIRFFKNPIKAFYHRILRVYYEEDNAGLEETEVFQLDHLEKWQLKNDLLPIATDEVDDFREKKVKLGTLPLKNMSRIVVEEAEGHIAFTKKMYERWCAGKNEEKIAVDLKIGASRLTGTIGGIFDHQLIRYSFSKREEKYWWESYLCYLVLTASGEKVTPLFISNHTSKVLKGKSITPSAAKQELGKLLRLYKEGHQGALPFHFDFGITVKKLETMDGFEFQNKIRYYFEGRYPCNDPYQIKEYQNGLFRAEGGFERYLEIADLLLVPVTLFFAED